MSFDKNNRTSSRWIALAISTGLLEVLWFASKCFNQIDFDGMSYSAIARHLHHGEFYASINGFRSPLMSWLIAVASLASPDYLHIGKLINIGAFLLSVALLLCSRKGYGTRARLRRWRR